jgi:hypothetical protein
LISRGFADGDDGLCPPPHRRDGQPENPLAVLETRLPWGVIDPTLAPKLERRDRLVQLIEGREMPGSASALAGAGRGKAGRLRMPIRLMSSLL